MITRSVFQRGLAAVGLAALAALTTLPLQASAATDGLPDGSWRQSCERGYVSGGKLYARCRHEGGYYQDTSVQTASCRAFGNRNGTLFCESPDAGVAGVATWSGSFRESCRNIVYDKHGKLQATCRKDNGTSKRSNLHARDCPSYRAGNRNGNLFCESGDSGASASRWDGSFRNSCRDASVNSNGVLTANCQAANGNWRRTSLSPNQCGSYRAGNRDGNLFCESGDSGASASRWGGSFGGSCRDASVNSNGVLTANCQTANGNWRRTSLSPNQCGSYRAGNRDGNLFCESGDSGASASRWDGSFRNSCRDASVNSNGVLTASCQTISGNWNRSSLSPSQCSGHRAGNRDGTLFCE